MMSSRWFSAFFLAVVACALAGLLFLGYFVAAISQPASTSSDVATIAIARGDGVHQISQRLSDAGLISSRRNFEVYVWLKRWGSALQAGEYRIPKDASLREVASLLARGRADAERQITVIEGWTVDDIASYLGREGVVSAEAFQDAARDLAGRPPPAALADKPATATLEGYLFPDTYRVLKGATAEEIVLKMIANFDAKLTPELRERIAARGQTVFQTLTMASLLEREVRHPEDLPLVADVFYKRLAAGWPLESDATLNYALPVAERRSALTARQLTNPSPYNTYRHRGLPPGPIGNPGLAALAAAATPTSSPYWFFLSAPDGRTIFAETHDEHVRNKQRYLAP